jgi:GntR family transcriptional regulator/MocR family aminotransferase
MHVVLELPARLPAGAVAEGAADRGLVVQTLERYYSGPVTLNGLILGYGATPHALVRRAAATLAPLLT